MKLKEFQEDSLELSNTKVKFALDNGVWLNATDVAKQYSKRLDNYWRDEKEYNETVANFKSLNMRDLKQTARGNHGGTYIHPDLIINFARWISPEFAIACDKWIKEKLVSNQPQIDKELFDELKSFMPSGSFGDLNEKNGLAKTKKVRGYYRSDKNDELSKLIGEKKRLSNKLNGFFDDEIKIEIVKTEVKILKVKEAIEIDKLKRLEEKKNDTKVARKKHSKANS